METQKSTNIKLASSDIPCTSHMLPSHKSQIGKHDMPAWWVRLWRSFYKTLATKWFPKWFVDFNLQTKDKGRRVDWTNVTMLSKNSSSWLVSRSCNKTKWSWADSDWTITIRIRVWRIEALLKCHRYVIGWYWSCKICSYLNSRDRKEAWKMKTMI